MGKSLTLKFRHKIHNYSYFSSASDTPIVFNKTHITSIPVIMSMASAYGYGHFYLTDEGWPYSHSAMMNLVPALEAQRLIHTLQLRRQKPSYSRSFLHEERKAIACFRIFTDSSRQTSRPSTESKRRDAARRPGHLLREGSLW